MKIGNKEFEPTATNVTTAFVAWLLMTALWFWVCWLAINYFFIWPVETRLTAAIEKNTRGCETARQYVEGLNQR